jgi:hypothetical protein
MCACRCTDLIGYVRVPLLVELWWCCLAWLGVPLFATNGATFGAGSSHHGRPTRVE